MAVLKRSASLSALTVGVVGVGCVLALGGCRHQGTTDTATAPPPPPPAAQPQPAAEGQPVAGQPAEATAKAEPLPPPIIIKDAGFKTPESVLYDAEQDVYLVSNINGKPLDADGNGFISKVSPDGKVEALKFIDGEKPGVTLNAPKGMTIVDDLLYVTDINFIRVFDRKTGEPRGKVGVGGATFLNDVAATPGGKDFYGSDSGLKAGKDGLAPTGSDSVFVVSHAQSKKVLEDKALGRPNGVATDDKGAWVVTYGTGELYYVTEEGKKEKAQKLPKGGLDGIVILPDGSVLVSSWEAKGVYRGAPGQDFQLVITDIESPADIGFDTKRNRVLVPSYTNDEVRLYSIKVGAAPAAKAAPAPQPAKGPAKPESKAAKPAEPAQPAQPAKPAAAKPAEPAKPATPAQPAAAKPEEKKVAPAPAQPAPAKQ